LERGETQALSRKLVGRHSDGIIVEGHENTTEEKIDMRETGDTHKSRGVSYHEFEEVV